MAGKVLVWTNLVGRWTRSTLQIEILAGIAIFISLVFLAPGAVAGCSWGGASAVDAPVVTPLRSYPDPYGSPGRVAVDVLGNIYATSPRVGKVLVWDRFGALIFETDDLGSPFAIAVSSGGDIYVGDLDTGSVLVFDSEWNLRDKLGWGDGEFLNPNDIAINPDPLAGEIYVSDGGTDEIKVYSPSGEWRFSFGGSGTGDQQFNFPSAVHVTAAGEVLVGDQTNDRVKVFDLEGNFLRCFGSSGSFIFTRKFGRITGLTTDTMGRFYVADAFQGHVKVFDDQGAELATIGSFGEGPGELRTPLGLVIDPFNRLFVASANTGRLEVYGLDDFSDPTAPPPSAIIPVTVELHPERLKRGSNINFVEVLIEVPDSAAGMIDLASITANGVAAKQWPMVFKYNGRGGISRVGAKFDAGALMAALPDGGGVVTVTGAFTDGSFFEGTDQVTVIPAVGGGPGTSK